MKTSYSLKHYEMTLKFIRNSNEYDLQGMRTKNNGSGPVLPRIAVWVACIVSARPRDQRLAVQVTSRPSVWPLALWERGQALLRFRGRADGGPVGREARCDPTALPERGGGALGQTGGGAVCCPARRVGRVGRGAPCRRGTSAQGCVPGRPALRGRKVSGRTVECCRSVVSQRIEASC